MAAKSYDVFISYRREGGENLAGRIRDSLVERGYKVFYDVETLRSGDFNTKLFEIIESTPNFVLVCTPHALDRCVYENDWVRREIRHALKSDVKVIPVIARGFEFPKTLPGDIDRVRYKSGPEQPPGYYDAFIERLCQFFESSRPSKQSKFKFFVILLTILIILAILAISVFSPDKGKVSSEKVDPATSVADEQVQEDGSEGDAAPLSVYASNVMPYTAAGNFTTTSDLPNVVSSDLATDRAFSIISFLRNSGSEDALVESTRMDVLDIEPIEDARLVWDEGIIDNRLYVFGINDGWGNVRESIKVYATKHDWNNTDRDTTKEQQFSLEEICDSVDIQKDVNLDSAEVARVARFELNREKFIERARNEYGTLDDSMIKIHFVSSEDKELDSIIVRYSNERGFERVKGGADGGYPPYYVTLFATLDVDNPPKSIQFTGVDSSPLVQGKFRVETVVAPTKSCRLTCRNVFTIEGTEQMTDEYKVQVTVRPYPDEAYYPLGKDLTNALMEEPDSDNIRLNEISKQHRYSANSILEKAFQ